ncbi:hypothetical protein CSC94_19800 [Zhengella mangrovi]|uniref:HTH crp-type domain-containing protein n=1 Tax=Zhengella mangrovi TaxID=1982044 RepID=A0A2G1QJH3_9HYPH|nr:helix-turn-helix domain-containing protein [Zhengella mangrovi]PHP65368.1 hypothetical protein CSC94_19800 [Zhengella mangrovi]
MNRKQENPELQFVRENFGTIWPQHLRAFTQLLIQLHDKFDGDLELLLILAVIGDRTRPEEWNPELLTYDQLTRGDGQEHFQVPINMQSIADFSGIPRETVRRKVSTLQKKGWVGRDGNGNLFVLRNASKELEESTNDSVKYLADILKAFETAKASAAPIR